MTRLLRSDYHLINILIFGVVLTLIIYLETDLSLVKCPYSESGETCKTCGLTRSMQKIIKGDFNNLIVGHLLLLILFSNQLVIRPVISFFLIKTKKIVLIRNIDILSSFIFAVITFTVLLG